jgi:hypothetical protein
LADWFACPLCGRQRPIEGWDPSSFDDEIKIRNVKGLGRGRGSEVESEWSAVVDSAGLNLMEMAKRCLKIVELCLESDEVSASDLVDDVPQDLVQSVIEEKTEDYGYSQES